MTKNTSLERELDRAIAQENQRLLNDPKAIAEARANGARWREQLDLLEETRARLGDAIRALPQDERDALFAELGLYCPEHRMALRVTEEDDR